MTRKNLEELVENLIKSVISENQVDIVTPKGDDSVLSTDQKQRVKDARMSGDTVKYVKKGNTNMTEKKEKDKEVPKDAVAKAEPEAEDDMDAGASAGDSFDSLKTDIQDIISRMEKVDDFKIGDKEDLKAKKLMNKIKLKMDDILLSMDELNSLKSSLDEERSVYEEKEAEKKTSTAHKFLAKNFKDKKSVDHTIPKIKKTLLKFPDADPETVAKAIYKAILKENASKK